MPRLTEKLFMEEANDMGLSIHGQLVNLSQQQWAELEERCRVKLNWPPNWKAIRWHKCAQEFAKLGWGTKFGPECLADYSASSPTATRLQRKKLAVGKQQGLLPSSPADIPSEPYSQQTLLS